MQHNTGPSGYYQYIAPHIKKKGTVIKNRDTQPNPIFFFFL